MGRWTAGVLAAVIATLAAGLIQNVLSGGQEMVAVPTTEATQPTETESKAEAASTSESLRSSEATAANELVKMLFTTYVWDESDGWVEHASWEGSVGEARFSPVLSAWNWSPNHPPVAVQFDDFKTIESSVNFDDGLSTLWDVVSDSGGSATVDGGRLTLSVPEGRSAAGYNRVDVFHRISMGNEFDVSVRFYLEDDFFSFLDGQFGLVIGLETGEVNIFIAEGEYRSEQISDSGSQYFAVTEAGDLEGGFRITGMPIVN